MANKLNESILSKVTAWAQGIKQNGNNPADAKKANALATFLSNEAMQNKMQQVAVDHLVQSFAQALNSITDKQAKQNAINQFWSTWKDKTNQALLDQTMKKYKLLPSKR